MGTLQNPNPNPNPYPNRSPLPNANNASNPNPNTAPGLKSPSFEEVSKLFSLPLSDAADSLGFCPSVLKKVCYDNGLVRWPYRKFQAGKRIEEIKKDAAIEKEKQLAASKVSGQGPPLASLAVLTSLAPQPQSTNTGSQQTPTSRMLTQQTRDNQVESFHNVHSSIINKGTTPTFDEFKYGFPSDGLSNISYRWWGNKSAVENGVDRKKSSGGDAEEKKQQPKDLVDSTANLSSTEVTEGTKDETDADLSSMKVTEGKKDETDADLSSMEVNEGKKDETDADPQWASSLSALRKRAAEDGEQALKLGVYRGYNVKTLDQSKKRVLLQIFRSSFPSEWGDMSCESKRLNARKGFIMVQAASETVLSITSA